MAYFRCILAFLYLCAAVYGVIKNNNNGGLEANLNRTDPLPLPPVKTRRICINFRSYL